MELRLPDLLKGEHPVFVLPFGENGNADGCQELFGSLGSSSFIFRGFLSGSGEQETPARILVAADMRQQYSIQFWKDLLGCILKHGNIKIAYLRYKDEYEEVFHTVALELVGDRIREEEREESPYASRKLKSLLEVLNRKSPVTIKNAPDRQPLEILEAERPVPDTIYSLYLDATSFVNSFLENRALPFVPAQVEDKEVGYDLFDDNFYSIGNGNADYEALAERVLQDAALSRVISSAKENQVLAFDDAIQDAIYQNDEFYWDLLSDCQKAFNSGFIAISHGYTESLGYMEKVRKIGPLPGLNGEARLEIVKNAVYWKDIHFAAYLDMAARALNKETDFRMPAPRQSPEPWAGTGDLYFCLPIAPDASFPKPILNALGCDTPSCEGLCDGVKRKLIFPYYCETAAMSKEMFYYFMFTLAMLYSLDFLLLQDEDGTVYRICCNQESDNLGETEKVDQGPVCDPAFWGKLLTSFSGKTWSVDNSPIKGEKLYFKGGMNRAMERDHYRQLLYYGQKSLKDSLKLDGTVKNAILYKKNDNNYKPFLKYLAGKSKPDLETLFGKLPVMFAEFDSTDKDERHDLVKGLAEAGCLVCLLNGGEYVAAVNIIPTQFWRRYWKLLNRATEGWFIGYSIGKPWYLPLSAEISDVIPPVASLDGALYRSLIFDGPGSGGDPFPEKLEAPEGGYSFSLKNGKTFLTI